MPCPGTQPHGIDSQMTTARKYRITSNNTQLSITYHTTHLPLDELSLGHGSADCSLGWFQSVIMWDN